VTLRRSDAGEEGHALDGGAFGRKARDTWGETHDSAVEQYGSDPQAEQQGRAARERPRETYGGVDARATKSHLLERARELDVRGRSRMTKAARRRPGQGEPARYGAGVGG